MDIEKDAVAAYAEEGIEFEEAPIVEEESAPVTVAEPVVTPPAVVTQGEDDQDKGDDSDKQEPSQQESTPREPRKRSIYQDLKETRTEVKTERELREVAERERDELRQKLEGSDTKTVDEDIKTYAEKIGADPEALQEMRNVFLKGQAQATPVIPPEFQENMAAFTNWQAQQSKANEATVFNQEFQEAAVPTLKNLFGTVSDEDMGKIKAKVDELAHTKQYADKDLDYVIWKEQEALKPLVSPKKPGIESKGRADNHVITDHTFDPTADISKMTPKEAEEWEKNYNQLSARPEGLSKDGQGKKIFI